MRGHEHQNARGDAEPAASEAPPSPRFDVDAAPVFLRFFFFSFSIFFSFLDDSDVVKVYIVLDGPLAGVSSADVESEFAERSLVVTIGAGNVRHAAAA